MKKFITLFVIIMMLFSVSCDSQPKNDENTSLDDLSEERHSENNTDTDIFEKYEKFTKGNPVFFEELETNELFAEFMGIYADYPYLTIEEFIFPDGSKMGLSGFLSKTTNPENITPPIPIKLLTEENGEISEYTHFVSFTIPHENEDEIKTFFRAYIEKLQSEEYGFVFTSDDTEIVEFKDNLYRYRVECLGLTYDDSVTYYIWVSRTLIKQDYYLDINVGILFGYKKYQKPEEES